MSKNNFDYCETNLVKYWMFDYKRGFLVYSLSKVTGEFAVWFEEWYNSNKWSEGGLHE